MHEIEIKHAENDYFNEEYYAGESSKAEDMKFFQIFQKVKLHSEKKNNKKKKTMTSFLSITRKKTCGISVYQQ